MAVDSGKWAQVAACGHELGRFLYDIYYPKVVQTHSPVEHVGYCLRIVGPLAKHPRCEVKQDEKNLWQFLIQARRLPSLSGCFWIDALSIDQSNLSEREDQVKSMAKIFGAATPCWGLSEKKHSFGVGGRPQRPNTDPSPPMPRDGDIRLDSRSATYTTLSYRWSEEEAGVRPSSIWKRVKGTNTPPPIKYDKVSVPLLRWDEDAEDTPHSWEVSRNQNTMPTNSRGEAD